MKRRNIHLGHIPMIALMLFVMVSYSNGQSTANTSKTLRSSGYAPVNGLKMYYEIHGDGEPLVLLHGSFLSIDMNFGELIPELAGSHKIIALEMQGHGRTADRDAEFSYSQLAKDVAGLLDYLKIKKANVLGYSLGGTVAYALAIERPDLVNRLIIVSSVFRLDGWIKEARDAFDTMNPEFFENTPIQTEYDRLAPDKSHFKTFVTKLINADRVAFDLGADNIQALQSPVLLIMGDNDGVDLTHVAEMYKLAGGNVLGDMAGLPRSQLAILPGTTHVTVMMQTKQLASIILPFLEENKKTVAH